jgi:hypothetical protein
LFDLVGGSGVSLDDLQKGSPPLTVDEVNTLIERAAGDTNPSQDGLLALVAELQKQIQVLESQIEHPAAEIAELQKQIQALGSQIEHPFAEIVELQKQVDALQLVPSLGAMALQEVGVSGSVTLAKITALGADGSLTFVNGIITAYTAPT